MAAATEQTITRLRRSILEGELAPGTRLQEVELAAQLGVSRTPVREALRSLASQGLVEILRNRGARVTEWSRGDLEEIYQLRMLLESNAAQRAAARMHTDGTAELTLLCERMEACAQRGETDDLMLISELNAGFHGRIIDAADSPRLARMIASVVQVPLVVRTFVRYSPEALARSMGHHRELVAAIEAGSPDWAGSVMRSHILAASHVLIAADAHDAGDGASGADTATAG